MSFHVVSPGYASVVSSKTKVLEVTGAGVGVTGAGVGVTGAGVGVTGVEHDVPKTW